MDWPGGWWQILRTPQLLTVRGGPAMTLPRDSHREMIVPKVWVYWVWVSEWLSDLKGHQVICSTCRQVLSLFLCLSVHLSWGRVLAAFCCLPFYKFSRALNEEKWLVDVMHIHVRKVQGLYPLTLAALLIYSNMTGSSLSQYPIPAHIFSTAVMSFWWKECRIILCTEGLLHNKWFI